VSGRVNKSLLADFWMLICALFLLVARSVTLTAAVKCGRGLPKGVQESGLVSKEGVAAAPHALLFSSTSILRQCQACMVMCSRVQAQRSLDATYTLCVTMSVCSSATRRSSRRLSSSTSDARFGKTLRGSFVSHLITRACSSKLSAVIPLEPDRKPSLFLQREGRTVDAFDDQRPAGKVELLSPYSLMYRRHQKNLVYIGLCLFL
jgi:hypothetical protein